MELFYNVWINPQTKIFEIVKFLLQSSSANSRTWSIHVRNLCNKYGLEDPLEYLTRTLPSKTTWKRLVDAKIMAYHEKYLRSKSESNSRMQYLNTNLLGLNGRPHPATQNMQTSWEVKMSRAHLKFLSGNYLTYALKSEQSGGSARCRICTSNDDETIFHVIIACTALDESRNRILEEFKLLCSETKNQISYDKLKENSKNLCQFLLDPASMNLPERVSFLDPILPQMYKLSRDLCYKLDRDRADLIQRLQLQ